MVTRGQYFIYLGEGNGFAQITGDGVRYQAAKETTEAILAQRFFAIIRPSMI